MKFCTTKIVSLILRWKFLSWQGKPEYFKKMKKMMMMILTASKNSELINPQITSQSLFINLNYLPAS